VAETSIEGMFGKAEYGALSTVDGRDARSVDALRQHLSESGLMKNRTRVEAAWLLFLAENLPDVAPLPDQARDLLETLKSGEGFSSKDMALIKLHEEGDESLGIKGTNHDVQAVERMLRDRFSENGSFGDHVELTHFGLTSEDVNNLAEGIGYGDARREVLIPAIEAVEQDLGAKAVAWANIPMLARTHGQPATPTTLGKELEVFRERIGTASAHFANISIYGKNNGATGGYNALKFVYPELEWPRLNAQFITSLGLEPNRATTQVEPRDWLARYLHALEGTMYPMADLTVDAWLYISQGYLKQIPQAGEIGSSTMAHKINPISFEKAESNFATSFAGIEGATSRLTRSRLQRDLSDSSTRRAVPPAVAHGLIGMKSLKRGLGLVDANESAIAADLDGHWEVLTEPFQQMMRRFNITGGYARAAEASKGKEFGEAEYRELVLSVADDERLPDWALQSLGQLRPSTYIGYAPEIALGTELNTNQ
jgi:adenylosuccinate lyase